MLFPVDCSPVLFAGTTAQMMSCESECIHCQIVDFNPSLWSAEVEPLAGENAPTFLLNQRLWANAV